MIGSVCSFCESRCWCKGRETSPVCWLCAGQRAQVRRKYAGGSALRARGPRRSSQVHLHIQHGVDQKYSCEESCRVGQR